MPYDLYVNGTKLKVEQELPRAMIDGLIFAGNLLVGPGAIEVVNRRWKSQYKIKGVYPVIACPVLPDQHGVFYRHANQINYVVGEPDFVSGVMEGTRLLGYSPEIYFQVY